MAPKSELIRRVVAKYLEAEVERELRVEEFLSVKKS